MYAQAAAHTAAPTSASLDKYGDDDVFSTVLHSALFVGAIFQLICIFSSILLPAADTDCHSAGAGHEDQKHCGDGLLLKHRKLRKQDKKKRR